MSVKVTISWTSEEALCESSCNQDAADETDFPDGVPAGAGLVVVD